MCIAKEKLSTANEDQIAKDIGWFSIRNFESKKRSHQLKPVNEKARYVFVNTSCYGIVWTNVIFFILLHFYYAYAIYMLFLERKWASWIFVYWYGQFSGLGVTCGAHRLWAHKSYSAKLPLRIFLIFLHTMAGQNDMYTWVRDHRLHHKFTETDADPHNSRRGAFFSHVGWLLTKKHPDVLVKGRSINNDDVLDDPVCKYQKKHYLPLYLLFRLAIPMYIPITFWDESFMVAFSGVFAQYITSLHITWFVNSAAHLFGDRPYNAKIQPRENIMISWMALGEGFHNYHHSFPCDYRIAEFGITGVDPARYFLELCAKLGLAYNLKRASPSVVQAAKLSELKSHSHSTNSLNPSLDSEFYLHDHPYVQPHSYAG